MLERLRKKWKVSGGRLLLILVVFATGGSLCGYAGRQLLGLLQIEKGVLWVLLYIVLITLLWPLCVLVISVPLGQFSFFTKYIKKIFARMSGHSAKDGSKSIRNIAIFASGNGTNADNILKQLPVLFQKDAPQIAVIITDNPKARVSAIADAHRIPFELLALKNKTLDEQAALYLSLLKKYAVDFVVLAGYLKMIPAAVVKTYPGKIINIHPALLPAYGGEGMYGTRVHEAVMANGDRESGISIHYVDEVYDNGKIIFQATCPIEPNETAASLAKKIHDLEYRHFPEEIAKLIHSQNRR